MCQKRRIRHNRFHLLLRACILSLISAFSSYASPSCQTNKQPLGTYDPKVYHNAGCTCPCAKRYDIMPDGRCIECYHLQIHAPLMPLKTANPAKLVNIPELRKSIAARARLTRRLARS